MTAMVPAAQGRRKTIGLWLALLVAAGRAAPATASATSRSIRTDIQTIRVPVFQSSSFRRDLGEQLTEAVVKEIEKRTPYKVVRDASADSVLIGRITSETSTCWSRTSTAIPAKWNSTWW